MINKTKKVVTEKFKLEKSEKYIAYMDILGFREMLRSPDFERDIASIAETLQKRVQFDNKIYPDLRYLAVSDTIVIVADPGEGRLLCRKIGQVQNALLHLGFAMRGGISFGEILTHDSKSGWNIFGNTFVAAYEVEQSLAIYPRVVVDKFCVDRIKDEIRNSTNRKISTYILRDPDGVQFVNQFSSDVIGLASKLEKNRENSRRNRERFRNEIADALKKTLDQPKAYMKWRWLMAHLRTQLNS
jgi:hypothetical protein